VLAPVWTDCPAGACRSSTASPSTPLQRPITRGSALRGINEGSSTSPVRSSPHPRPPGWNGPPLRLSPELRTPPTKSRTTHVGAGTGHRARTSNDAHDISRTSNLACLLNACDLVSQARKRQSARRLAGGCFTRRAAVELILRLRRRTGQSRPDVEPVLRGAPDCCECCRISRTSGLRRRTVGRCSQRGRAWRSPR